MNQSLICESCAAEQGEAIWQTMAPAMDAIYELAGDEPIPEALFKALCECKTVSQVREAFAIHAAQAKIVEMPWRDDRRAA